jgi:lysophospholipase L1-like esterase
LGLNYGRFHGARISSDESFNIAPHPPARRSLEDDGVFGLGGTRVTPRDKQLGITLKLDPALASGHVSCQLLFRYQRPNDRVAVVVNGRNVETHDDTAITLPQGLRLQTFKMDAQSTMEIRTVAGNPELFGLVVENETPGLVVDVLGINGARFATPLAWEEESWKALVKWRRPTLVVIAYGTNEVFDLVAPKRYRSDIQRLMDRIRSAVTDFDCVLAGPTDVGKGGQIAEDRAVAIDQVENEAAEQMGCAYFSTYQAMGGAQGFDEWLHSTPALALPDRIHLTAAGYRKLGQLMGNAIVGGAP